PAHGHAAHDPLGRSRIIDASSVDVVPSLGAAIFRPRQDHAIARGTRSHAVTGCRVRAAQPCLWDTRHYGRPARTCSDPQCAVVVHMIHSEVDEVPALGVQITFQPTGETMPLTPSNTAWTFRSLSVVELRGIP